MHRWSGQFSRHPGKLIFLDDTTQLTAAMLFLQISSHKPLVWEFIILWFRLSTNHFLQGYGSAVGDVVDSTYTLERCFWLHRKQYHFPFLKFQWKRVFRLVPDAAWFTAFCNCLLIAKIYNININTTSKPLLVLRNKQIKFDGLHVDEAQSTAQNPTVSSWAWLVSIPPPQFINKAAGVRHTIVLTISYWKTMIEMGCQCRTHLTVSARDLNIIPNLPWISSCRSKMLDLQSSYKGSW